MLRFFLIICTMLVGAYFGWKEAREKESYAIAEATTSYCSPDLSPEEVTRWISDNAAHLVQLKSGIPAEETTDAHLYSGRGLISLYDALEAAGFVDEELMPAGPFAAGTVHLKSSGHASAEPIRRAGHTSFTVWAKAELLHNGKNVYGDGRTLRLRLSLVCPKEQEPQQLKIDQLILSGE